MMRLADGPTKVAYSNAKALKGSLRPGRRAEERDRRRLGTPSNTLEGEDDDLEGEERLFTEIALQLGEGEAPARMRSAWDKRRSLRPRTSNLLDCPIR